MRPAEQSQSHSPDRTLLAWTTGTRSHREGRCASDTVRVYPDAAPLSTWSYSLLHDPHTISAMRVVHIIRRVCGALVL